MSKPEVGLSTAKLTGNALPVELAGGVLLRIGNDMWGYRKSGPVPDTSALESGAEEYHSSASFTFQSSPPITQGNG